MATRTLKIITCDVCGVDSPNATHWTIRTDKQQFAVDLCQKDAAPLEAIKKAVRPIRRTRSRKVYDSPEKIRQELAEQTT